MDYYSPLNPTRIAAVNGRFMFGSFNSSFSLSHHRFLNGTLGPLASSHPPPYHSSLPRFAHPSLHHQPPLLPLPDSKSTPPALSPTKRAVATVRSNQQQHQRKPRPSAKPKNEKKAILVTAQKSKAAEAWEEEEREEREVDAVESIYSISPPPSSLPLPRFSLPRPKSAAPAASCVVEAMEGGGVDIGATDSLRRLLRL